jgi:6-phospho-beta-glucosidase
VKYWMTFNEINNQMNYKNDIFGWTNSGAHFGDYPNPEEAMYQCGHYELVASALAVKIGKEINPEFPNREHDCDGADLSVFVLVLPIWYCRTR